MELHGKLAAVTGAAMGMGKCVSRMLLEAGCRVALIDVNATALDATADELSQRGDCRTYTCDISHRKALMTQILQSERKDASEKVLDLQLLLDGEVAEEPG